jgi:hypothetical protein
MRTHHQRSSSRLGWAAAITVVMVIVATTVAGLISRQVSEASKGLVPQ